MKKANGFYGNGFMVIGLQEELMAGEEVATCPSCSLVIKVIYDVVIAYFNQVICKI